MSGAMRESSIDRSGATCARLVAASIALFVASVAIGQSREVPAPPQSQPVVIVGATVHPVGPAGALPIERGWISFDGGRITGVGPEPAPAIDGARVLAVEGLHVYPGLVSCDTALGLEETNAVQVTLDHTETGEISPEVRAAVAVNPDSDLIPVARSNGILTAHVIPRGGIVSGRSSIIRLDGWTWEEMAIDADAGLVVNWPRTEPVSAPFMPESERQQEIDIRKSLDRLDDVFSEARAYVAARDNEDGAKTDLRYEAMRAVLAGEKPLFVRASSAGQIESAVAWGIERGLRPVIVGGFGAGEAIPILLRHDVPVIVGGVHRLPENRDDPYDGPFTLPARLHAAGVRFAIASGAASAHERHLNHNAATAAAYGLPREVALEAVTMRAAEILGVGDRLGTLEIGKSATLIVTSGDPLEITTETVHAFIDGREIDLGNRQKALYGKYRKKYRQLGLIEPD